MNYKDIKLIIWDLDETFWQGTLSEGEVEIDDKNVQLIKDLSKRGIINSISSKNNFDDVKTKLVELGIWDNFVFPIINWEPKGKNIERIISQCQLRPNNVLFIDDNHLNLKEAEFFNKGIMVSLPECIDDLKKEVFSLGKDDSSLSRLSQYKLLEKKASFKEQCSSNIEFLKESNIKISFIRDCQNHIDRIYELVQRTNQLNYTKKRDSIEDLKFIISNPDNECACVHITDRFGDYGVVGFYALNKEDNKLIHFIFSCRIINIGVENYIYNKLNKPELNIVVPVAAPLNMDNVDWIEEVEEEDSVPDNIQSFQKIKKILFLGGCDLEQLCHYIDKTRYQCLTDFNYPNSDNIPIHREHTAYLKQMKSLSQYELEEIQSLPFGDRNMFNMNFSDGQYDVLVYSVLMNYTHEVYTNKNSGYKVSYGGYLSQHGLCDYLKLTGVEREHFISSYRYDGLQSPDDFYEDLKWLAKNVKKPIIFINGAEVEGVNDNEPDAYLRHCEMNRALDKFISEYSGQCHLLDVRKFVSEISDFKDTIRHYKRIKYFDFANELMYILDKQNMKSYNITRLKYQFHFAFDNMKLMLKKIRGILKNIK